VRASREECLDRLILFGELGYAAPRCVQAHSYRERSYHGLDKGGGRASRPTQAEQETVLR
jgi:hypothetical protein